MFQNFDLKLLLIAKCRISLFSGTEITRAPDSSYFFLFSYCQCVFSSYCQCVFLWFCRTHFHNSVKEYLSVTTEICLNSTFFLQGLPWLIIFLLKLSENFTMGSFRLMSQDRKCDFWLAWLLGLKLGSKSRYWLLPCFSFPPSLSPPICSHSISQQGQKLLNICLDTGGAWLTIQESLDTVGWGGSALYTVGLDQPTTINCGCLCWVCSISWCICMFFIRCWLCWLYGCLFLDRAFPRLIIREDSPTGIGDPERMEMVRTIIRTVWNEFIMIFNILLNKAQTSLPNDLSDVFSRKVAEYQN